MQGADRQLAAASSPKRPPRCLPRDGRAPRRQVKWGTCALSEQPLAPPIVADFLGALFNKCAVLEWLLARRGAPADADAVTRFANQLRAHGARFEHIASLKDVFAVDLVPGAPQGGGGGSGSGPSTSASRAVPGGSSSVGGGSGGGGGGEAEPMYRCPVTELPCGLYTMVALVPCGHVISERALARLGLRGGGSDGGGRGPGSGKASRS